MALTGQFRARVARRHSATSSGVRRRGCGWEGLGPLFGTKFPRSAAATSLPPPPTHHLPPRQTRPKTEDQMLQPRVALVAKTNGANRYALNLRGRRDVNLICKEHRIPKRSLRNVAPPKLTPGRIAPIRPTPDAHDAEGGALEASQQPISPCDRVGTLPRSARRRSINGSSMSRASR